jgi:hypothetical protein
MASGRQSREGGSSSKRGPQPSTQTSASTTGPTTSTRSSVTASPGHLARGALIIQPSVLLLRPKAGAVGHAPPRLVWAKVRTASIYNVQLYRAERRSSAPGQALRDLPSAGAGSMRVAPSGSGRGRMPGASGPLSGRGRGAITAISSVRAASGTAKASARRPASVG